MKPFWKADRQDTTREAVFFLADACCFISVSIVDGNDLNDLRCNVGTNLLNQLFLWSIENLYQSHQPYNLRYFKMSLETLYDIYVDMSPKSLTLTGVVGLI